MPSSNESPRGAVEELIAAINARDYDGLTKRLDLKAFIDIGYDDAIDQLALNCDRFHQKYPDDLLFKFGATALRTYNALFRSVHIGLIIAVINRYFKGTIEPPKSFSDDPIAFCSFYLQQLISKLKSEIVKEERDKVTIKVTADDEYKNLIGTLQFELETASVEGRFKVIRIANVDELVEPIVDIAERVWPREWDRGIQL